MNAVKKNRRPVAGEVATLAVLVFCLISAVAGVVLCLLFPANAAALDFSQSVARVTCQGRAGSGCVFYVGDRVLISTAGHATQRATAAYVEFRPGGKTGYQYPAEVVKSDQRADWAVLAVETSKFVGWKPTPIRPIQDGQSVAIGSQVYFAGYAGDNPLRAGVGTLTGRMVGLSVECSNEFVGGESGGPVVAIIDGTPRLIGIVVERFPDRGTGGFTPINAARQGWKTTAPVDRVLCQCGPSGCPTPQQPRYQPLRPGQRQQQRPELGPGGPRLPSWIVPEVPDATPAPSRGGALAEPVPEIGEVAPVKPKRELTPSDPNAYPWNDPNAPKPRYNPEIYEEYYMPNGEIGLREKKPQADDLAPVGPETQVPGMDGDTYQAIIERANEAWQAELRKRLELEAELKSTAKALADAGEAAQKKIEAEQAKAAEALKSAKEAAANVEATAAAQIEAMSEELEQLRQQAQEHAAPVIRADDEVVDSSVNRPLVGVGTDTDAENPTTAPAELTLAQRAYRDLSWLLIAAGVVSWVTWFIAKRKKAV